MARKPRIHLLATGGTIAGQSQSPDDTIHYTAGALSVKELLGSACSLAEISAIRGEDFCHMGSEDMTPQIWQKLGRRLRAISADPATEGIVVTHGTDTMAETAFFLQMTCPTPKPIVLTGAMRPATAPNADGPQNLRDALLVASAKEAAAYGVTAVMNGEIFSAAHLRKNHSSKLSAFSSAPKQRLGHIQQQRIFWEQAPAPLHPRFASALTEALPEVAILTAYAGMTAELPKSLFNLGIHNLIFDGFGNGTLPRPVVEILTAAQGIFIVTGQTGHGTVVSHYPNLLAGGFCTAKQARILCMLALATGANRQEIAVLLRKISEKLVK